MVDPKETPVNLVAADFHLRTREFTDSSKAESDLTIRCSYFTQATVNLGTATVLEAIERSRVEAAAAGNMGEVERLRERVLVLTTALEEHGTVMHRSRSPEELRLDAAGVGSYAAGALRELRRRKALAWGNE